MNNTVEGDSQLSQRYSAACSLVLAKSERLKLGLSDGYYKSIVNHYDIIGQQSNGTR